MSSRRTPRRRTSSVVAALAAAVTVLVAGCASGAGTADPAPGAPVDAATLPIVTSEPSVASSTTASSTMTPATSTRDRLAVLVVDDRPTPQGTYRRDDWPHWDDVDGNGCDARQDALLRWTTTTPTLDPDRRCKVRAGTWVSPFDGAVATDPSQVEVDHLVPLAEAFRSGGWRWEAPQRRRFANDPMELVPTSSASNRAKGDSTPDEWRPARAEAWCAYADRYVAVKDTYDLTVTTEERDALGRMLDTCGPTSDAWP